MFGITRRNPFEDLFGFQREVDRLFQQAWREWPARSGHVPSNSFQVAANDEGWRFDVPMPGIDPAHVTLEVAGNVLSIRAEVPVEGRDTREVVFEQTVTLPQYLDVDRLTATHRHGLLQVQVPLKDAVKPRRVEIQAAPDQKQLTAA